MVVKNIIAEDMPFTKSIFEQFLRSYCKKTIFVVFHFLKFLPICIIYFEIDWSYWNKQELDFKLQRPKVNNQTVQVERSWCESSCQRLFPPNISFNKIKEICPQKDLRVWPTLTKGELLGDLQDEPNGPRDVLHLQCNGCRGDLQVSLSMLVNACQCCWSMLSMQISWNFLISLVRLESHSSRTQSPISKKKMSVTPLKRHKSFLRGGHQSFSSCFQQI